MHRHLLTYLLLFIAIAAKSAALPLPAKGDSAAKEPLRVSVVTCAPGEEVYQLYGHSALRIQGATFDSVWNYGLFDFEEPNFIGRFVKGNLRYAVGGYPFSWFINGYQRNGRRVVQQVLNISQAEAYKLRHSLQVNSLPANRTYLYDYVRNNCATKVWDKVVENLNTDITYDKSIQYSTFREAMRAYHSHYPWYSMGIDIALAYPVDTLITAADQRFLPDMTERQLSTARRVDNGEPLVLCTETLNAGMPDATLPPTPWWEGPLFWACVVAALAVIYAIISVAKSRTYKIFEALFFAMIGLAGVVVAYLALFSTHASSSPNLLLAWLNPLALIVPICIWSYRTRPLVVAYMVANVVGIIFVGIIWPMQEQCGNAAFLPLLVADVALAAPFVINYVKSRKISYRS